MPDLFATIPTEYLQRPNNATENAYKLTRTRVLSYNDKYDFEIY